MEENGKMTEDADGRPIINPFVGEPQGDSEHRILAHIVAASDGVKNQMIATLGDITLEFRRLERKFDELALKVAELRSETAEMRNGVISFEQELSLTEGPGIPEGYVWCADAAREVGCGRSTVSAWVSHGEVPGHKVGTRMYVDLEKLRERNARKFQRSDIPPAFPAITKIEGHESDYMDIAEVSKLITVGEGAVRSWVRRGDLPSYRPGRKVLIRREDLQAFLEGSRRG